MRYMPSCFCQIGEMCYPEPMGSSSHPACASEVATYITAPGVPGPQFIVTLTESKERLLLEPRSTQLLSSASDASRAHSPFYQSCLISMSLWGFGLTVNLEQLQGQGQTHTPTDLGTHLPKPQAKEDVTFPHPTPPPHVPQIHINSVSQHISRLGLSGLGGHTPFDPHCHRSTKNQSSILRGAQHKARLAPA